MKKFDIVIIGSGPGGFISADFFAEKGLNVCLIEQGDHPDTNSFFGLTSLQKYYDNKGVIPIISQNIFGFAQGKVLGGGSVINGALFWQLPRHTKLIWDKIITSNEVEKIKLNFDIIKEKIGVKDSKILNPNNNLDSEVLLEGANKLNWKCISVPRALNKCNQINNCGFGCPALNKNSVDILYKDSFLKNGGTILVKTKCVKIKKIKNKILSILVSANNKKYEIYGKIFILGAGAINSNLLLQKSNITHKSFIQFHLNLKITAIFNKEINADKGTMFTYQVQEFENDGTLFMPTNFNQEALLSAIWNLNKIQKEKIIENYTKSAIYVCQVQPKSIGKIRNFFGFPFVTYFLTKDDKNSIRKSIKNLVKLLFIAGAERIYLPTKDKRNEILNTQDFNLLIDKIKSLDFISVHSMSANRMGKNISDSVTDIYGKVHNIENLYIVDASSLPTSVGESPQGVIMENSLRVSEYIFKNHLLY